MSIRHLSILLVKMIGIFYLVSNIISVLTRIPWDMNSLLYTNSPNGHETLELSFLIPQIFVYLLNLAIPFVVIFGAPTIVSWFGLKRDGTSDVSEMKIDFGGLTKRHALQGAVLIAGILMSMFALEGVISEIINPTYKSSRSFSSNSVETVNTVYLYMALAKLFIGILLLTTGKRIAGWIDGQEREDV